MTTDAYDTEFMIAIQENDTNRMALLENLGVLPLKKKHGIDPLKHALMHGAQDAIAYLLNGIGKHTNELTGFGGLALKDALAVQDENAWIAVASTEKVTEYQPDGTGTTLVHRAAYHNHALFLLTLYEKLQVPMNEQDHYGFTPLMFACMSGAHKATIMLLYHARIDPNLKNAYGHTAFDIAHAKNHKHLFELLTHADAKPGADLPHVKSDSLFETHPIHITHRLQSGKGE